MPPMVKSSLRFLPTKSTFELGEQIGVGTVGVVYRGTSPDLDHPVAVKLLHPGVSGDRKIVDRFEREIAIMERLDHPNIVRNYGGGILDGQYFYAMQLLEHGSLKDRLVRRGALPWPQAATYAVQIASALQHAHNHGIVHRDLKPSNLFYDEGGNLVLGDFGIARDTYDADITAQGITVGTYAYMSPEQIRADGNIDGKADLYSLGCVLYEMLAGRPPYQGANFAQIWEQHLNSQPESLTDQGVDCPKWLEELTMKLLSKEPAERPFNARAVEGVLREKLIDQFGEGAVKQIATDNRPSASSNIGKREINLLPLWLAIGAAVAAMAYAITNSGAAR